MNDESDATDVNAGSALRFLDDPAVKQLCEDVSSASNALQRIQNFIGLNAHPIAKQIARVSFPRGYLSTADTHRQLMPFVSDSALRSNLAYTLILANTVRWLVEKTDLWGVPRDMLIKLQIFLYGTIIESITKDYLHGVCGGNFKARNKALEDMAIVEANLRAELDWIWDERNKMHLFQLEQGEYENDYNPESQKRCEDAFSVLLERLSKRGRL